MIHTVQTAVMYICLAALGVMGAVWLLSLCARKFDEFLRAWGTSRVSMAVAAVAVVGVIMYGGSKPLYLHDDTLTLSNCWASNDTQRVHIEWERTSVSIPNTTTVYIDYRLSTNTNGEWTALATSTMGTKLWEGTVASCTNYDYYVYSDYVPPTPVHTNGVWQGYGGVTKDGKKYITINGRIVEQGDIIATPEQKRKAAQ